MKEVKNENFEQELMTHLNSLEMDKKSMSLLSTYLVQANKAGMKLYDWHLKGQPPRIDELIVKGSVENIDSAAITRIFELKNWKEIFILRRGIPIPHELDVHLTFQPHQG
ncbi:MAG TPA: hypothetical protein VK644_13935 [Chitinophagaceae bacterium]|nr:hypothetical protein [Chitinophagaceae bacterium]